MHKTPPRKFKKTKQPVHSPIQKSIIDTLKYRQIFGCPMNTFQIWNYLISTKEFESRHFETELANMVNAKKIMLKDSLYSLGKIDYEEADRKRKRAEKLVAQAKNIGRYLKQIPWIEMVAVTGSVAALNADEHSDIDILIVTKPKRLYLSRFFLVLILKLIGIYWNVQKPAGTICPNILVSSDSLTWNKSKQNLYTANEIALLYPIFFRNNCYFDFIKQNSWVKSYLPNIHVDSKNLTAAARPVTTGKVIDLLEHVVMKFQMLYMKNKKTTEIVSKNFIHFNIHDSSSVILKKFQSSL